VSTTLKQLILEETRRLGFILAGVTTPEAPTHLSAFETWLARGRHASMSYLATQRSRARRADPHLILPECKFILVLAVPYDAPPPAGDREASIRSLPAGRESEAGRDRAARGRVAAYAQGNDYHEVLPARLQAVVEFIERHVGYPVSNRWYIDTGPVLERDLARRAGLGWIGKNTCLINPKIGSYVLLAEIFLDLELEPDAPFVTDHCGTCTRCIDACPTDCILPDRTLDARRCISYLTIELKDEVPTELRTRLGDWIFGCDICQSVCPWNRFATEGDPAFRSSAQPDQPDLIRELELSPGQFNRKFRNSPVRRSKRRGYLRNVAVALGNVGGRDDLPALANALQDSEPLVRGHAAWAIEQINERERR
jgi:epoxyqueuosine reductase